MRRWFMVSLALLLAALPALSLPIDHTYAATTSRVAIIKSVTGTVEVKKAGGSKEFRAFAKMSLNEGDILTTSANSTAVLQFANGTPEDDRMTVSANTTLAFSKLSDRNGTRTKVSMFNGKAWVQVKSIAHHNDEFVLETPNAILDVRGTHFYIDVDPVTGNSRWFVASGIVRGMAKGGAEIMVLPGQEALVTRGKINTGPVNLDALFQLSTAEIIEAILDAAAEIALENNAKTDRYENDAKRAGFLSEADIARFKKNVESLVGAIVQSAIASGKISPERIQEIVAEAQARSGITIDLNKKEMILSDEEKRRQQLLLQKLEESRKRAEQRKQTNQVDNVFREQLIDAKRLLIEASRAALDERRRKALAEYVRQLSDAERERFERDRNALMGPVVTPPPSSGGGGGGGGGGDDDGLDPSAADARLDDLQLVKFDQIGGSSQKNP